MRRFSIGEESGIKGLFFLAGALLVGALGYHFLAPMPAFKPNSREEREMFREAQAAKDRIASLSASVEARTWEEPLEDVGPKAMAEITRLATASRMTLNGIRPQRVAISSGLESLPMTISVEGPYLQAIRFIRSIEDSSTKLAVSEIQTTAADGATDRVTMTVQVIAYKEAGAKRSG